MPYRFVFVTCVCLGLLPAAVAAPPTAEQLIADLSAGEFQRREAAARILEDAGESALPALRKAQPHPDPDVRARLAILIARLERTHLLAPKLITLSADQRPVAEVFAEIGRQTGYRLMVQPGNTLLVTVKAEAMPFWQLIDTIGRQTGLGLQQYFDGSQTLMFHRTGRVSPHVMFAGPFRVAAVSFHHSRTQDLTLAQVNPLSRQTTDTLTLMMNVIGEPKVPLMSLGQPRLSVAEDDLGRSLVPPQVRVHESHYHHYYYGYRNPLLQTQVQLQGHGEARSLRRVAGNLPITFLAEQRPEITVENVLTAKGKKFESSQVVLEVEDVKELPGRQVHVKATARRSASENQYDYTWTNSLGQRVELFDSQGQKFNTEGFNWDNGTPTSVSGTFQFGDGGNAKLGQPAKLVYYNWITTQHQIEFDFRDLPLP